MIFTVVVKRAIRQNQIRSFTTNKIKDFPVNKIKFNEKDKNFFKDMNVPAAYPVAFFTVCVLLMGITKVVFFDAPAMNHKYPSERTKIDFLENNKTAEDVDEWNHSVWRKGIHKVYAPFTSRIENLFKEENDHANEENNEKVVQEVQK